MALKRFFRIENPIAWIAPEVTARILKVALKSLIRGELSIAGLAFEI